MTTEYYNKYESLAQKIGIKALRDILPVTSDVIKGAISNGDEYLNSIPLHLWDRAAGLLNPKFSSHNDPVKLSWAHPFTVQVSNRLSLADRVCVLKHVAKYHLED